MLLSKHPSSLATRYSPLLTQEVSNRPCSHNANGKAQPPHEPRDTSCDGSQRRQFDQIAIHFPEQEYYGHLEDSRSKCIQNLGTQHSPKLSHPGLDIHVTKNIVHMRNCDTIAAVSREECSRRMYSSLQNRRTKIQPTKACEVNPQRTDNCTK